MGTTALNFMYIVLTLLIGGFGLLALYQLYHKDLSSLVSEADGKASLSRFQALIFTFVIAGLILVLSIEHGAIIEVPESVLGILGISLGGYTVSKGIQAGVDKNKQSVEAAQEITQKDGNASA